MALGSGRGAVIRQLMVESVVLGLAGGSLGLAVGAAALQGLKAIGGETFSLWKGVTLDWRVLAVTMGSVGRHEPHLRPGARRCRPAGST